MPRWFAGLLMLAPAGLPMLAMMARPAVAQTRTVTGQAGILAEWDLSATITQQTKFAWSGPLNLKHVGFCSVDGPEEKNGELRLLVSEPSGEVAATLLIGGDVCTFNAPLKDGYEGVMHCPDWPDVPMMLFIQ